MIETTCQCFRCREKGKLRRGVWVMTRSERGLFVHGDRNEVQPPVWDINYLLSMSIDKITPEQALEEVSNWPQAHDAVMSAFNRHPEKPV